MAAWEYDNFDLLIETESDGEYRARVIGAPTGEAPTGTFRIPFEPTQLENLMLKLDPGRSGTRRVAADPQSQAALELGSGLFEAVFSSDIRLAWARSIDTVRDARRGLRLRLRLTEAPAIAVLPWELLHDRRQNSFIAQSERTPVVRYLEVADTPRTLDIDGPLRILVVIASPTDMPELDVEAEWNRVNAALADRVSQGTVQLDRLEQPTLQGLSTWIRRHDVHVLHFIGHGEYDRQAQDGVLYFCDQYGRPAPVSSGVLGPYLRDHDPLRLIVLNACQAARMDSTEPVHAMAQALVQQDCVALVTMQFPISGDAAAAFTGEFYGALADGLGVDQSVSSGRKALLASYASEWATPVLFLRDPQGQVFDHIVPLSEDLSSGADDMGTTAPAAAGVAAAAVASVAAVASAGEIAAAEENAAEPAPESVPPSAVPSEPAPPAPEVPTGDPAEVLAALRVSTTDGATAEEAGTAGATVAAATVPMARAPAPAPTPTPLVGSGLTLPPDTVRIPTGTSPATNPATSPATNPASGVIAGRIIALVLVVALLGYLGWWFANRPTDDDGTATPPPTTTTAPSTTSDAPAVVSQQVTVAGATAWTDARVACEPGKSVQLVASGTVFHDPTNGVGPGGSTNASLRQFNLPGLSDANHGALVASLDAKAPFTVVGDSATYTCGAAGELFLGPNDSGVDNNHGEWTVTVTPSG